METVTVSREDAITAAGACVQAAGLTRRQASTRRNAGPANASHRAWLRELASEYEAAGRRLQAAADEAWR